jgi:hypothetical protein
MMRRSLAAIVAVSLLSTPAAALITRADRDDAEYVEMATRYTAAIVLGGKDEAVLIGPRWVLASPATASALQAARAPRRVEIAGRSHEVPAVHIDPASEVGLILLQDPVRGIEPIPICRDSDEAGKAVVIVGHSGGKKRASINTVDRVAPRQLALRIKPLDEASDLQGVATAAEIGAPAFLEKDDGLCLAGLLQAAGSEWQTYSRGSAFASWIQETLLGIARKDADKLLDDTGR